MTSLRFLELSSRGCLLALELVIATVSVMAKKRYDRPKPIAVTWGGYFGSFRSLQVFFESFPIGDVTTLQPVPLQSQFWPLTRISALPYRCGW